MDIADGTVPVLAQQQLDYVLGKTLGILRGIVQEHDHIRVLLDGAGFSEVAELRSVVVSLFDVTGHLGEEHDGHSERSGVKFHVSRHGADRLDAVGLIRLPGGHELEVVDDYEIKPVFALEPAALGHDVRGGVHGVVVDVQLRVVEPVVGADEPSLLGVVQAHMLVHARQRDLPDIREHTLDEQRRGHFEGEYRHGLMTVKADIRRDVERERRLSDRRTGGDEHEFAGFQSAGHAIQILEPREHRARRHQAFLRVLYPVKSRLHGGRGFQERLILSAFGDGEDGLFGVIQRVYARLAGVGVLRDVVCRTYDLAGQRVALDDVGVVLAVRGGGHKARELYDIVRAAHIVEVPADFQPVRHGSQIYGRHGVVELLYRPEHQPVARRKEILLRHGGDDFLRDGGVDEHRAQHRPFGFVAERHGASRAFLFAFYPIICHRFPSSAFCMRR